MNKDYKERDKQENREAIKFFIKIFALGLVGSIVLIAILTFVVATIVKYVLF